MGTTLIVVLYLLASAVAYGQLSTATLTGVVRDSTGAVVPEAVVILRNAATTGERRTVTNSAGNYTFLNITPGRYTLETTASGFRPNKVAEFELQVNQTMTQDTVLEVGTLEQAVQVEATAEGVQSSTAELGAVVAEKQVADLPLNGRNFTQLLTLTPGVAPVSVSQNTNGAFGTPTTAGAQFIFPSINGQTNRSNFFRTDGINNQGAFLSTYAVPPIIDTIQEFKVITNPYSSEYGRSPGAAVLVTTKGGTNEIHGVAYEYLRNNYFDANDFFSNKNQLTKPQNNQNQFGASLGAPILRNKLFGFFNYEGTRISRGVSRISTVPLANERIGDFSPAAAAAAGINPYPTIYDPSTGLPFTNNQIPSGEIDPFATKIMALFPLPNLPGPLNNYARNAQLTDNGDTYNGRVDWVATPQDSVFVRYTNSNRNRFIPGFYGGIGDGTSTSAWGRQVLKGQSAVIGWTHVFSPTFVNEFRVGFTRSFSFAAQDPFGQNQVDEFVPGVPENPAVAGGISQITLTNFTFIGSPDFLPKQQVPQQYQWADNASKTIGKHSLKFGVDLRAPMRNIYQDEPGTRGSLTFDKIFTCQRDATTHQCTGNTGLSYADFLLGEVKGSQLTNVHFVDQRLWMLSGFVQDDFKLRRNLTLNLGLRYDFATPALEGKNQLSNFDPTANGGAGGLISATNGSLEDRALVQVNKRNFAPRIGVSYAFNPKTVIRGGYGIYYMLFERFGSEDQLALNAPFLVNSVRSAASTAAAPLFLLKDGFPANSLDPNQPGLLGNVRIRAVNPQTPTPYVQQWSLGFQRDLPWNFLWNVDYVGTRSLHLDVLSDANQPLFDGTGQVGATRPFPTLGYVEYQSPIGFGKYNGIETGLERRFNKGFSFRLAYTYSRSIDNTPQELESNSGSAPNGLAYGNWFGPSDFDTPHRFVANYVYELPFGRNRHFLHEGVLSYIVGGFKTSGVYTFASGRPFTLSSGGTIANSLDAFGAVAATPNLIGPPVIVGNVSCWYFAAKNSACTALRPDLTDAFQLQSPGFLGNVGRNTLRGPHTNVFDFALMRDFPIHESIGLQFRWEVFNLTNTVQFGQPSNNFSSGSAGTITSLAGDPRVMQFALRYEF